MLAIAGQPSASITSLFGVLTKRIRGAEKFGTLTTVKLRDRVEADPVSVGVPLLTKGLDHRSSFDWGPSLNGFPSTVTSAD